MRIKHDEAIKQFFELFFEDWMSNEDKQEFIVGILDEMGITLEEFDRNIEIGLQNGYSVEQQIELCKHLITELKEIK